MGNLFSNLGRTLCFIKGSGSGAETHDKKLCACSLMRQVCNGHLSKISPQFSVGSQIKFNHVAKNTLENLNKTHCIVFSRCGITSYHRNPNFKNVLLVHQFIGQNMKNSSQARFALWAKGCPCMMYIYKL